MMLLIREMLRYVGKDGNNYGGKMGMGRLVKLASNTIFL